MKKVYNIPVGDMTKEEVEKILNRYHDQVEINFDISGFIAKEKREEREKKLERIFNDKQHKI